MQIGLLRRWQPHVGALLAAPSLGAMQIGLLRRWQRVTRHSPPVTRHSSPVTRLRLWRDERGNVLVLMGLMMGVLVGLGALVTDVGMLYWNRRIIQNAVDGAALAGGRELPANTGQATNTAMQYAANNGVPPNQIDGIDFFCTFQSGTGCPDTITVRARVTMPPLLRAAIGVGSIDVGAAATALAAPVQPRQLAPWGVTQSALGPGQIQLKMGAQGQNIGNFYGLDFPSSSGGSSYSDYILNGYNGYVPPLVDASNAWEVNTQTGNLAGPTTSPVGTLVDRDPNGNCNGAPDPNDLSCPRIVVIPIIQEQWVDTRGTSIPVHIVGFAPFYLEGARCSNNSPSPNCPNGFVIVEGHWLGGYVNGVGNAAYGQPLGYSGIKGVFLWN